MGLGRRYSLTSGTLMESPKTPGRLGNSVPKAGSVCPGAWHLGVKSRGAAPGSRLIGLRIHGQHLREAKRGESTVIPPSPSAENRERSVVRGLQPKGWREAIWLLRPLVQAAGTGTNLLEMIDLDSHRNQRDGRQIARRTAK